MPSRLADVADPQGAVLALLNATGGDPADVKPGTDEWLWTELLTNNPEEAATFYEGLAGYQYETRQVTAGIDYRILTKDGIPRAGVVKVPWETVKPNWLAYIKVDDPQVLAARVESLGGKLLLPPDKNIRNGSVAVVADPIPGAWGGPYPGGGVWVGTPVYPPYYYPAKPADDKNREFVLNGKNEFETDSEVVIPYRVSE